MNSVPMRPRRNIPQADYKGMLDSPSEDSDSDSTSSLSDVAQDQKFRQVVHLPTASEIVETEAFIKTQNEELAMIDIEYQALKRKIRVVEMKRNVVLQRLLKSRSHLARVRTLPQEVLSHIFLFYIDDDPLHSPWTLMQVTRAWRATALSTRTLWAKIMLTSPAWKKHGASRWKSGREVCGSKEQLDKALRRAGNAPLDIAISLNSPLGNNYRRYDMNAIESMVFLLASTRKCLQVQQLQIDGQCCFLNWPSEDASLEFPNLQSLRVTSRVSYYFVARISTSSKRLKEMRVPVPDESYNFYFISIKQLVQSLTMVSLSMDGESLYRSGSNSQQLYSVINSAKYIITLELNNISFLLATGELEPTVELPHLRVLILRNMTTHWLLSAPLLTNLTLLEESSIPKVPWGSEGFPRLTSLTIVSPRRWVDQDPFSEVHFPHLHTLDVCLGERQDVLSRLMDRRSDLNPVVFCLRNTAVRVEYLTKWIGSMGRLEELRLEKIAVRKQLFEFLASEPELHCPLLGSLEVDIKGGSAAQNREIKRAATKAANARRMAGLAVDKWLVRAR